MRKNLLFIGLALSMLAVGCNNDPVDNGGKKPSTGKDKVTVTVNATLPEGETWAEGDVYVVNNVETTALGAEANGAQTAALVALNPEKTAPVFVLGPAALRTGVSEVAVGDTQHYVANGYDRSVRVWVGGAAEALPVEEGNRLNLAADIQMHTIQGVLTLPLVLEAEAVSETPVAISEIALTALGDETLCGTYEISLTDGGDASVNVSDKKSSISLVCDEPVVLNGETPVNFNFVLQVGQYSGFEFVVTDTESRKHVFTVETETTVANDVATVLEQVAYKVIEKAPATLNVTIAESGCTWLEGDAVVCNNELSSVVAPDAVGTQTAAFDFKAVAYPYEVFYPADLYSKIGSLRFSDEQQLIKGGYDRSNIVMIGYSATTDVEMKNLCGVVTLPFKTVAGENLTIDYVTVESVDGTPLAGKFHINYRNCTIAPVNPRTALNLVPAEPVTLVPDEETTFSFVVPAGSYAGGLKLTIATNFEVVEETVLSAANSVEVRAGEATTLAQYTYEETKIPVIATAEDFAEFVKAVNKGRYERFMNPETGEYILGGDIDLAGVSVEAGTGTFAGVFNGKGYKILNWNAAGPIFGKVETLLAEGAEAPVGGVKDLTIDASCSMAASVSGGAYGFIAGTSTAPIENCVNNGKITLSLSQSEALYVGGLVGDVNGVAVTNCNNYGEILVNMSECNVSELTEAPVLVGGVFGRLQGTTATSCNNYAAVTFDASASHLQTLAIAGLAGYSQGSVSECNNEGAITAQSSQNLGAALVAGLAGYQEGMISNSNNTGALTMEAIAPGEKVAKLTPISKVYPSLGGIVAIAKNAEVNTCNNTGALTTKFTAIEKAGAAGGRFGIAGIVGNPWGTVKNCKNTGKLDVQFKTADGKTTTAKNHIPCVGGIVGADYYSTSQSDANVENCTNEGDIYYHNDCSRSNTTCGGIVAWPGKEGSTTSVTTNCVNKGNIDIYGAGKGRIGTIHGGGGSMVGCTNYGNLTIYGNSADSTFGGLTGYGAANNTLENCANYGNVVAKVKVSSIGGMCGQSAGQPFDWGHNCIINCTVQADVAGTWAAMLVGRTNDKDAKNMTIGTASTPIKVAGTLIRTEETGVVTTVMSAETMTVDYLMSAYCTHTKHTIVAEYYTAQ